MSFSEAFVKLLQKYEDKLALIHASRVTLVNGVEYQQTQVAKDLVYDLESKQEDYEASFELISEDGNESYYIEEAYNTNVPAIWEQDINEAFAGFIQNVIEHAEVDKDFFYATINDDDIELLLGCFYCSIGNSLHYDLSAEYTALKKEYPDVGYYPRAQINTDSLFYFESSRCW